MEEESKKGARKAPWRGSIVRKVKVINFRR
jgi:hypothetical protein